MYAEDMLRQKTYGKIKRRKEERRINSSDCAVCVEVQDNESTLSLLYHNNVLLHPGALQFICYVIFILDIINNSLKKVFVLLDCCLRGYCEINQTFDHLPNLSKYKHCN